MSTVIILSVYSTNPVKPVRIAHRCMCTVLDVFGSGDEVCVALRCSLGCSSRKRVINSALLFSRERHLNGWVYGLATVWKPVELIIKAPSKINNSIRMGWNCVQMAYFYTWIVFERWVGTGSSCVLVFLRDMASLTIPESESVSTLDLKLPT